jgi:hypothetical protein
MKDLILNMKEDLLIGEGKRYSTNEILELLYLNFFNDYLTVEVFAEDYGISTEDAEYIINKGRELNHKRGQKCKQ